MKTRRLASIALVAAVMLGTAGCTFITPQATDIEYNAADGVGLDVGGVQIRDALIIADESGRVGNFAAAVINTADSSQVLTLEYGPVGNSERTNIRVAAGETLTLGNDDVDPVLLVGLDTQPGAMLDVQFSVGDDSTVVMLPVLDGSLPQYEHLVPSVLR